MMQQFILKPMCRLSATVLPRLEQVQWTTTLNLPATFAASAVLGLVGIASFS